MIVFIDVFSLGSESRNGRVDVRAAGLAFKFMKRRQLFHLFAQRSADHRDARPITRLVVPDNQQRIRQENSGPYPDAKQIWKDRLLSCPEILPGHFVPNLDHRRQAIPFLCENLVLPRLISLRRYSRHVIRRLSIRLRLLELVDEFSSSIFTVPFVRLPFASTYQNTIRAAADPTHKARRYKGSPSRR